MPAKTKRQFKYIRAMRNKYKSEKKAPENMKWVFGKEWTDVSYKNLPESFGNKHINNYIDFINENYKF